MPEGWANKINEDMEAKRLRNRIARAAASLAIQAQRNRLIIRRDGKLVIRLGKPPKV